MRLIQTISASVVLLVCLATAALAVDAIEPFVGDYTGSAEVETYNGTVVPRDMSVSIHQSNKGFVVKWSSITYREGKGKEKAYQIEFVPSEREGVFAAAMTKNVFGHAVQMDPMKGEPYVWARIKDDTLTVYSLFVDSDGGYELQQFDRTLKDGGLQLEFQRFDNGTSQRTISTFLTRQ